jgi:hypothetical protein
VSVVKPEASASRRSVMRLAAVLALATALIGVAMAETHDPVAIEPDAPRADGAQVATFALG